MRALIFIFFGFFLASCSREEPVYHMQSFVFGTMVDITIYGEPEEEAQAISNDVVRHFQDLHNRLHAWRPSEITSLNHAFKQGKVPVKIEPDIAEMIADATEFSVKSKGAFNPAIGALVNEWGFHRDEFKPVTVNPQRIAKLVQANPLMVDIVIENGKVFSTNSHVKLDMGGYAKGYALDQALLLLRKQGVRNALINIGGNIIALGQHGEQPWRVGIQHPRQPNAIATLDLPSGWAIGTSGDYQRYFELKGKRYSHVINPATGYPAQGVQSVTVLIPPQTNAGVLSDVASKPIFIASPEMRATAAAQMEVKDFLIIESGSKIIASASMAKRLTWLDKDATKYVAEVQ